MRTPYRIATRQDIRDNLPVLLCTKWAGSCEGGLTAIETTQCARQALLCHPWAVGLMD
jgi:hypothetical protein